MAAPSLSTPDTILMSKLLAYYPQHYAIPWIVVLS